MNNNKIPPTLANVENALNSIHPDLPRDQWLKLATAVKDALGENGKDLFDSWSSEGSSYSKVNTADTWRSIKTGGKTTVGTLFYEAGKNGWKPDAAAVQETDAERQKREQAKAARDAKAKKEAEKKAADAVKKTLALCKHAGPAQNDHPYLLKKAIAAPSTLLELPVDKVVKILGYAPQSSGEPLTGRLLIAVIKIGDNVSTAELIDENGKKAAIAGGIKSAGYWASEKLPEGDGAGAAFFIAEGVATTYSANYPSVKNTILKQCELDAETLSHYEQTIAIAAFSDNNLPKVANYLRKRYPKALLIVLADSGNGQSQAVKAASQSGAKLAVPQFTGVQRATFEMANNGKTPTDFNDLHQLRSLRDDLTSNKKNSETLKNPSVPSGSDNNEEKLITYDNSIHHESVINPSENNKNPSDNPSAFPPIEKEEIKTGVFVYVNDDGKPVKVIESKAAKILAGLMRKENYAYNSDVLCWHKFTGNCWERLQTPTEPERVILQALFKGTEPVGFKQAYFGGVLSIMLRAGLIPLPPEPIGKIPFKNGLLDIDAGYLTPITPNNASTWVIPHNHYTGTHCPTFMAWLNVATGGDADTVQLLRAYINACLIGRPDLQKFLHLLGPGGTGKSTFIRLLFAILGDANCITTDLKNMEENKFETACFYGKRLVAITDSDKYGGSVNVLKAITGQDYVRNERKHAQMNATYIYQGMVLIASNEPLASTDYTSGLGRRPIVVKFEHRIKPEERSAFIRAGGEEKIHEEIPAIINWALKLSRDEVTETFMYLPQKAIEAAFESLTAQNPIVEWISDNLIPALNDFALIGVRKEIRSQNGTITFEDADNKLYPNYLQWCSENKRESLALRRFRHTALDMIRTMGIEVSDKKLDNGMCIIGVKILREYEKRHKWS